MSDWKEYKLDHVDFGWEMRIEIRQDKETETRCREMVEFFANGERRLKRHNNDAYKAFASFVAPEIMWLSADYNLQGIIKAFENKEGFYSFTEENGIRLKHADDFIMDDTDFYLTVIEKENTGE